MNNNGWARLLVGVALVFLIVGLAVGGFAGYLFAREQSAVEAVAVAQPAPSNELEVPVPGLVEEADLSDEAQEVPLDGLPDTTEVAPDSADAQAGSENNSVVTAVERVQPATVRVLTNQGSGSGVIISEDGYVVTNNHVVEGAQQFAVDYARGERIPATLVGRAPEFDLAVLKVNEKVPAVAAWGDSSTVPLGEPVIAIGSPLGQYQNTVTVGILSGANRTLSNIPGLLQTDAAINPGNSGGPLLNRQGEVIGINTLVVRGGGVTPAQGLGFAIPSNLARNIAQQLIETGRAERPLMGVQLLMLNSQNSEELGLSVSEGAYIQSVTPNGPSQQAGIQPGDVVIAVNGRPVTDRETLQMQVFRYIPGESVTVSVLRDGQQADVELTLTSPQRLS
ncbi:MAG: S1C family serine protease [Ardenticatenaceae bacterium]